MHFRKTDSTQSSQTSLAKFLSEMCKQNSWWNNTHVRAGNLSLPFFRENWISIDSLFLPDGEHSGNSFVFLKAVAFTEFASVDKLFSLWFESVFNVFCSGIDYTNRQALITALARLPRSCNEQRADLVCSPRKLKIS